MCVSTDSHIYCYMSWIRHEEKKWVARKGMPFGGSFGGLAGILIILESSAENISAAFRAIMLHSQDTGWNVFSKQFDITQSRRYQDLDLACYLDNKIATYTIIRSEYESDLIQILDQDLQSTFASGLGHQGHLLKEDPHCCVRLMSNVGAGTKLVLSPSFHFHETIVSHLSVQFLMDYW